MTHRAEQITDILRKDLGVSKEALDAYDPPAGVRKLGNRWLYRTINGSDAPAVFNTKTEAVKAATGHKQLKQEQYDNPQGFRDIVSVLARQRLALINKYESEGMSEWEADARALREIPDAHEPKTAAR